LLYSRVTQTFNGTVTIKNISNTTISGPVQLVFGALPNGISVANATGSSVFGPYLTVTASNLLPNQSVTVAVQFKDPSNAKIQFSPVIYSGSL